MSHSCGSKYEYETYHDKCKYHLNSTNNKYEERLMLMYISFVLVL